MKNRQCKLSLDKENGSGKTIKPGGYFYQIALLGLILAAVFVSGYAEGSYSNGLLRGSFMGGTINGLEYKTETQFGVTDANGTFMYRAGENITFLVGDIVLGKAPAQPLMTMIDLVEGATDITHPMVTNMARFLQTLDADMNPENGITITEEMVDAMVDHMIDFNMDPAAFEYDPNVRMFLETMNKVSMSDTFRMMVSIEDAQEYLINIMDVMMSGNSGIGTNSGMVGNNTNMMSGGSGMGINSGTVGNNTNMMSGSSGMRTNNSMVGSDTGMMSGGRHMTNRNKGMVSSGNGMMN